MSERGVKIWHRILLIGVDAFAVTLAAAFAYFSTLSTWIIPQPVLLWWGANVALAVLVFLLFNLYNVLFVSVGFPEMSKALLATVALGVANAVFALVTKGAYITVGTAFVYAVLLFCITSGVRLWKRGFVFFRNHVIGGNKKKKRVMIYSAITNLGGR